MKKCIISIVLAFAALSASAQEFAHTPYFYTGRRELRLSMIDNICFGFIQPSASNINLCGADFIGNTALLRNREFSFNVVNLEYVLYRGGSIGIGMDLHWSNYRMNKSRYWEPYDYDCVRVSDPAGTYNKVRNSVLRVMSFDIPFDFTQQIGPVGLTVGVSGEINLPAIVRFRGVDTAGETVKIRNTSISKEVLTANVHAALTVYGIGMYVKYRPIAQFTPDSGPVFTSWSAGIILK